MIGAQRKNLTCPMVRHIAGLNADQSRLRHEVRLMSLQFVITYVESRTNDAAHAEVIVRRCRRRHAVCAGEKH